MKQVLKGFLFACFFGITATQGQTTGNAKMEVTLLDYTGTSGQSHYTVAWVTTGSGTFIKTLRKQGPSNWSSSEWVNHCGTWNTARAGSTVLDGYTSATASNYSGTNSPVIINWNCRDASNNLMPDGNYKFWVQYAENSGQGPYITSGLLWTKGPVSATNTYPNQGVNFANMRVTWTATVPPSITSGPLPASATLGVPFQFACTASGSPPITFSAVGLPPGLSISSSGLVSGIPRAPGVYSGTITAGNGVAPQATQGFTMQITVVPVVITWVEAVSQKIILQGTGPANGTYTVLTSPDAYALEAAWLPVATNSVEASGLFRYTNSPAPESSQLFYKLRIP